jgi:hypothetical protein
MTRSWIVRSIYRCGFSIVLCQAVALAQTSMTTQSLPAPTIVPAWPNGPGFEITGLPDSEIFVILGAGGEEEITRAGGNGLPSQGSYISTGTVEGYVETDSLDVSDVNFTGSGGTLTVNGTNAGIAPTVTNATSSVTAFSASPTNNATYQLTGETQTCYLVPISGGNAPPPEPPPCGDDCGDPGDPDPGPEAVSTQITLTPIASFAEGSGFPPSYACYAYRLPPVSVTFTGVPQITNITQQYANVNSSGTFTVTGTNLVDSEGVSVPNFNTTITSSLSGSPGQSSENVTFSVPSTQTPGNYQFTISNMWGTSNSVTFTVLSPAPPPSPCALTSNSQAGYSSVASAGASGGSGTMAVSFSGSAYAAMSASASYGPYSTPSSIASNIAALITKNYYWSGLTARAFGPSIVYSGNTTLGAVTNVITGNGGTTPPFTTNTSSEAATAAETACESAGGDSTPSITGIVPNDWASGQTTSNVTFSGVNFGSNAPTLGFSPGSGISYSLSSYSDTQIVANVSVASGTPTEQVAVTVTSNGYGGSSFTSGGSGASPTSAPATATVHAAPVNSPEITVVGWIDVTAPDIVNFLAGKMNSGVNSTLMSNLNSGNYNCVKQVGLWVIGLRTNLSTQADVNYVNVWGIAHSPNSNPGPQISQQTLAKYPFSWRLFNDYGGNAPNANTTAVGSTPDPCQWLPGAVSYVLDAGTDGPSNGAGGTSATGKQYQIAEGRVGPAGQRAYKVVNSGRTVPWIYSVIEFDSSGNPTYSDVASFPTYSVYQNSTLLQTHPQSTVLQFFNSYDQSNVSGFSPIP